MSKLEAFLAQNIESVEKVLYVASDRIKDPETDEPIPWELKPLTEKEISSIRKQCKRKVKGKHGQYTEETDGDAVASKMIVASVVFPNLNDAQIQASHNVLGAENLLFKMLYGGEYTNLMLKVQEISGYDKDMEELIDDAKN